ncbi:hypothetical protein PINS_up014181 [Pythium insidiosum]|nr:hypothetical protein PINS_up014181 [Pythium insidiosum]
MHPSFRVIMPHTSSSSSSVCPRTALNRNTSDRAAASVGGRVPIRLATSSEDRCLYSGRPCPYQRATKRNGESHRMCQLHRERANHTQRRVAERRRERQTRTDDGVSATAEATTLQQWLPRLQSLELDDDEVQEIIEEVWQATQEPH